MLIPDCLRNWNGEFVRLLGDIRFLFAFYFIFNLMICLVLFSTNRSSQSGKNSKRERGAPLAPVREVLVQALAESLCCLLSQVAFHPYCLSSPKKLLRELERLGFMPLILVYALLLILKISCRVPRAWLLSFLTGCKGKTRNRQTGDGFRNCFWLEWV